MNRTRKILTAAFVGTIALNIALVLLSELVLRCRPSTTPYSSSLLFILLTVSEILTICAIPLTLRLFKFPLVRKNLAAENEKALLRFGLLRIFVLALLMTFNTVCYCIFSHTAFGYLAIILFLSMMFVYPSEDKCRAEIDDAHHA